MNIVLFDTGKSRSALLPFTFTRPVADIRLGILTLREKWEVYSGKKAATLTEGYLQGKYANTFSGEECVFINGSIIPDHELFQTIQKLGALQVLTSNGLVIAFKTKGNHVNYENFEAILKGYGAISYSGEVTHLTNIWQIFQQNDHAVRADFKLLTHGKTSQQLSSTNTLIGSVEDIFIEEGAVVEASVLNTKTGPVYIRKNSEVMENCAIRGPFALCESAVLKMSSKVYGATTLGPHCKAGGEMNNVVMFGYSNKAHDGFLGNSVIGEWCNLGADTNNSNLKNNYSPVEIFSYAEGKTTETGLTFCGLFMGDHSKAGINTMFNTGTVVGVSANVFGGDFPPKFIPSFSWGGSRWLRTFSLEKSIEVAELVMSRRHLKLSEEDIKILTHVYELEAKYRRD